MLTNRYKLIANYRDDETLRNEFHHFISRVFPSISFQEWESNGFWINKYIPFSICKSGKIISNVSASLMDILINSEKIKAIQLGAVGTLPEYRNQGLSCELMNYIISKYKNGIDLFFLFANETVLDFYPKFGFRYVQEYIFIKETEIPEQNNSSGKINIKNVKDYILLQELLKIRQPLTKILGAENYDFITMWHILNLYPNNLYYIEEEDVIIIKQEKNDTLHILDVIYHAPFDLESVIPKIVGSDTIKSIKFYFSPDQLHYRYDKFEKLDTGLFILGNLDLPEIPFRFPLTAIT